MVSDLIRKPRASVEPVDAVRPKDEKPPNMALLLTVSIQAVLLVAVVCVAVFLGGKLDAAQRIAVEAKEAAILAQKSAAESTAHARYVSCEVQRSRPSQASAFFTTPVRCEPPPSATAEANAEGQAGQSASQSAGQATARN